MLTWSRSSQGALRGFQMFAKLLGETESCGSLWRQEVSIFSFLVFLGHSSAFVSKCKGSCCGDLRINSLHHNLTFNFSRLEVWLQP